MGLENKPSVPHMPPKRVTKSSSKVSRACDNCRRRKIKCTGKQPCSNCQAYQCHCEYSIRRGNGTIPATTPPKKTLPAHNSNPTDETHADSVKYLYKDDSSEFKKISCLENCIEELESTMPPSPAVSELINKMKSQISEIESNLKPQIDAHSVCSYKGNNSIETELLKNRYTDQVWLTRFSIVHLKGSSANQMGQPLIDSIFGMYCPALSLSLKGIGSLFKKLHQITHDKAGERALKETLYIVLRFFDMCLVNFDKSSEMWSTPIEFYFSVVSPQPIEDKRVSIKKLFSQVPDFLFSKCAKEYPCFESCIELSQITHRTMTSEERFKVFRWIVALLKIHHKEFRATIFLATGGAMLPNQAATLFSKFSHVEEILSTLSFEFFLSTSYIEGGVFEYLETLLDLIESQYWIEEFHVLPRLLSTAILYARDMGLNRWEFYVGLDEEVAEKRRTVWWKCYGWDKYISINTGKEPMIHDSTISCLYPNCCRKAGFIDPDEMLESIHKLLVPLDMELYELLQYAHIALSRIVGDFYCNVLYNQKYTDFRNHAKPEKLRQELLVQLVEDIAKFRARHAAIKVQSAKIFEFISYYSQTTPSSPQTMKQFSYATQLSLFYEFCLVGCLTSVDHLIARFTIKKVPAFLRVCMHENKKYIHKAWNNAISLSIGNKHICLVWQNLRFLCFITLTVLTEYFTYYKKIAKEELILALQIAKILDKNDVFFMGVSSDFYDKNGVWKNRIEREFLKQRVFFQILARFILQLYLNNVDLSVDEFIRTIIEENPTLADTAKELLNARSQNFKPCLVSREKSGFHVELRRVLEHENVVVTNRENSKSPEKGSQLSTRNGLNSGIDLVKTTAGVPHENNVTSSANEGVILDFVSPVSNTERTSTLLNDVSGPPLDVFNLGTLDDFVNNGDTFDVCNALWDDFYMDNIYNLRDPSTTESSTK